MGYVGQVTTSSTTHKVGSTLYGTCATAAATAAKVVTLSDFDMLVTGVTVHVKFTYSNTASSATLKVGSTDAKPLTMYGTTRVGTDANTSWPAGSVVSFTYDGTSWVMNGYKEGGSGGDVYYLRQDYLWLKLGSNYTTTTTNQTLTGWADWGSVGSLITYGSGIVHLAEGYSYMVSGTVSCQGTSSGSLNTACELIANGFDFSDETVAGVIMTSPLTSASFATGSFGPVVLNATNSDIDIELVARSTNGGSLIRSTETTMAIVCVGPVSADILPASGVSF